MRFFLMLVSGGLLLSSACLSQPDLPLSGQSDGASSTTGRPTGRTVIHPLGGQQFRIPEEFFRVGLGASGFVLWIRAADFSPWLPLPSSRFLDEGIEVSLDYDSRFSVADRIQRRTDGILNSYRHLPAFQDINLDGVEGRPVPDGLRYLRALPVEGTNGVREDAFVAGKQNEEGSASSGEGTIFCTSASSRFDPQVVTQRRCNWARGFSNLQLRISFDQSHLNRWREIGERTDDLLRSFLQQAR
jgi:hypothetical protein